MLEQELKHAHVRIFGENEPIRSTAFDSIKAIKRPYIHQKGNKRHVRPLLSNCSFSEPDELSLVVQSLN